MTQYAWPGTAGGFAVNHFELRISPNLRVHVGPYSRTRQAIDLLGERWGCTLQLTPTNDRVVAGYREAFIDRLKGEAHTIGIWHLARAIPLGTMRGSPSLGAGAAQLANTANITGTGTLLAGDMIGIGGQPVRVMANITLPGVVEFQPRLRVAMAAGTGVTWSQVPINMALTSGSVPTVYTPGVIEGGAFELTEVW